MDEDGLVSVGEKAGTGDCFSFSPRERRRDFMKVRKEKREKRWIGGQGRPEGEEACAVASGKCRL